MPLKLMISVIIMAVVASSGFGALSSYSRSAVESGLRNQAEALASAALRLDSMGLNSSRVLELRIEGVALAHVEYFKIGYPLSKPLHPYSSMVRFKGSGTDEGHVYVKDSGGRPLPLCSGQGKGVEVGEGTHRLLLTRAYDARLDLVYIQVGVMV